MKKKMPLANQREAVILAALLHGERFGLEIRDQVESRTNQPMPLGSLYTTLDRMEAKGFIRSRLGESSHERGGNRRRYFELTAVGRDALNALLGAISQPRGRVAHA